MHIVRTEVAQATAPNGEPIMRVLFRGEGGECVTVDMASSDGAADAMTRAKAILIQTASFPLAANEYEVQSGGNFDEVAVTSAFDQRGDVYMFEYRDGEAGRLRPPARMPSFDAARKEAMRCAIDLLLDLQPGVDDPSGWLVRMCDENGEVLCTIDVAEAEAARQANA